MARKGKSKTKKRVPTEWNLLVNKVMKDNPGVPLTKVLKMASTMKKKGAMSKKK